MRVCVGDAFPGGPNAEITDSLEESEMLDYFELKEDGSFEHIAQTRKCLGGCTDLVESIIRRGTQSVIVKELLPGSLLNFTNSGVHVYLAEETSVRESLDGLHAGELKEIGLREYSARTRKRK